MLVDALGDGARSFQLMGEDLALVRGRALRDAGLAWEAELEKLPAGLRGEFEREDAELAAQAHRWLRKYNRNLHTRVAGYLALGRRCDFRYPWPVVAILGICQVMTAFERNRVFGLAGRLWPLLGKIVDGSEDILRRTNRGIFADSVPTVLRALRADELRRAGRSELGDALIDGPTPPLMDAESRHLARALYQGLDSFAALSALTLEHFSREQAIFSHHMGPKRAREGQLVGFLSSPKSVPAPVVANGKVMFRSYALPRGFDMRDHDVRVREFGRAFVESLTRSEADYRVAVKYVLDRFGTRTGHGR
jgi:hypothetical protein